MDSLEQSRFDMPFDEALQVIRDYSGPVLVNLDETLYLRNSTEDFIDTACPATLAFILLKLLDLLCPWLWTGGLAIRDVWRIRVILLFFPWTLYLWRQRVTKLASKWTNQALLQALHENLAITNNPPVIVTLGFVPVVKPLISALGLSNAQVVAMNPWNLNDRQSGKLVSVTNAIGEDKVRKSLLITESLDDNDILEQCARPLRVIWSAAHFVDAFSSTYIPGQYTAKIKRPGQQYIYRVILREDFVFWLLCSLSLTNSPLTHIAGLALLLLSFWIIYEWGYMDNDRVGARYESKPHLSTGYHLKQFKFSTPLAWAWASVSGVFGLFVLRWPDMPAVGDLIAWAGVLFATFCCYFLYNRLNKLTRIWLYAPLRFLRVGAFIVVVPIPAVGVAALCAYTVSRWVPYMRYVVVGGCWVEDSIYTSFLLFFCIICVTLGYALGWSVLWSSTFLALFSWSIYKARHELKVIINSAYFIDTSNQNN